MTDRGKPERSNKKAFQDSMNEARYVPFKPEDYLSVSVAEATGRGENPKDAIASKKVNVALVPPSSIIHEAMAMENGALKYGPYNWRDKKVRATVYVAAAMRHLMEYLDGANVSDDTDPPVHHLAHAKACCGILLDAMESECLVDDRPTSSNAATRLVKRKAPRPASSS